MRSITVGNMLVPQLFADVDVTLHIALERSVVESADSFTNESLAGTILPRRVHVVEFHAKNL